MAKREKQRAKIIDQEESVPKETASFVFDASDDDREANEDLSLKIVEKALSMQKQKLTQNGIVSENNTNGGVVELAAEAVVAGSSGLKKRKKKKKVEKIETEEQSVVVAKEEENVEIIENPKTNEKDNGVVAVAVSGEPNNDEVPDNLVLRKLLRGPRYFDPPDSGWSTCYNCGEEGHMAVNCKLLEKKRKPCFVCGSLDHGVKQCSKGQDCFICKKSGHRAKDCPEKGKSGQKNSRICLKCGDSGHEMFTCRNNYSADDLKEIQCYVCKSFGHLCCANSVDDSPMEVSCYKCGEPGHTGLACSRSRDEGTVAASPSSCYKCGDEGHFARECTGSTAEKKNRELTSSILRAHRENIDRWGSKSAPHDLHKAQKRRKTKSEKKEVTTPQKSKKRGGWIVDDPGDLYDYDDGDFKRSRKSKHRDGWSMQDPDFSMSKFTKNRRESLSTPPFRDHRTSNVSSSGHKSSFHYRAYKNHSTGRSPYMEGSTHGFQHRYSASRFGSSANTGTKRGYDWW